MIDIVEALELKDMPNIILATLDVKAIHPSIPQNMWIELILQKAILTTPITPMDHPMKTMLRDMLKLLVRKKIFKFHSRTYQQTKGMAMGIPCAPSLRTCSWVNFNGEVSTSGRAHSPIFTIFPRNPSRT